jgi:hypothetical protein
MSTSVCTDQEINRMINESMGRTAGTLACEYLKAEHGISLGIQQDGYFLIRENKYGRPFIRASLSKASGALIGPAIALLDKNANEGFLLAILDTNIKNCFRNNSDIDFFLKAKNMLSAKDYAGVLITIASQEKCEFHNVFELLKGKGRQ